MPGLSFAFTFTALVSFYINYPSHFSPACIIMELLSFFHGIHVLHVYYMLTAAAPRAKLVPASNGGTTLFWSIMGNTLYHMKFKASFFFLQRIGSR